MAEKTLKTRIINKHGTEADWDKATNFIPKQGELIVYDIDSTHTQERIKIGDGKTVAKNLSFTVPTDYIVSGSQTTTSSADGGSNVFTFTKNDGTSATFTVKNGSKGSTGATGTRGSRWSTGTAITGTSTTATIFSSTGITDALVNDMYLNTTTGNTYRCTVAGAASAAKWVYAGSIKGATGSTGATPTITASASVDANIGTPSVTVTKSGTTAAPSFTFAFKNLKGAKGSDGVGVVTNLNGATTTGMSIYAPTSPGTSGYYLRSNGVSVEPTWVELSIDDGDIG